MPPATISSMRVSSVPESTPRLLQNRVRYLNIYDKTIHTQSITALPAAFF